MTPHKNIVEALNCLAFTDTPCIHGVKFPLCSYVVTEFLEKKIKILDFDKNVLQEFRKTWGKF